MVGEIYIRRIPITDIPRHDEEEVKDFLMKLYQDKDELKDNFLKTGSFTGKL